MSSDEVKELSTEVFFKDTFDIDDFLSKCTQKSDLVSLRSDLKHYGQNVYATMLEILKSETDNIVNLAEDLTNLSTQIDELAIPVAQLKEEIRSLYNAVNGSELSFKQQLDIAHTLSAKRDILNLRIGILSSITYIKKIIKSWNNERDVTILERAVNEYSVQYLYSCELGIEEIIREDFVVNIAIELLELVHKIFLKSIKGSNNDIILRCLCMYANLNKQKEAENFLRVNVIRPVLSRIFTQNYLDEHNNNMQALYNEAYACLNTDLNNLHLVLQRNPDTIGFNFIINSFWVEVDKQLRDNLPNITAPGNPDFFQNRYQHTQEFIEQILVAARTPNLYEADPSFEAHLKRFNLPVYFEIRFQQIAVKFEVELLMNPAAFEETMVLKNSSFMLSISDTLWNCVQKCFYREVYLVQLSDQLLKLVMLLVSRYITWYETVVKWPETLDDTMCKRLERFVMYTLMDIVVLKKLIGLSKDTKNIDNPAFEIVPRHIQPALSDIFRINNGLFDNLSLKLEDGIIDFKIRQCTSLLQQVSSIPRNYRRTNRSVPTEHSSYITETVLLLTNFYNAFKVGIEDRTVFVLDKIVAGVSDSYIELVREVLKSVCKTEESLKRLKNRNSNVSDGLVGQTKSEDMSDEKKIREQIKLDVGYFVRKLQRFSTHTSKSSLKKLLQESGVNKN